MNEFPSMLILAASGFGGMIALATLFKVFQECMSRKWPSVQGRILLSEEQWKAAEGLDRDGGAAMGNYARVDYEYEVSGQKYRAHRVNLGQEARNAEVAKILARYPAGSSVTVYYNPARPDAAILERQPLIRFAQGLAGILAIIACGAVAAFFGVKHLLITGERLLPNARHTDATIICGALGLTSMLFGLFSMLHTIKERLWPAVSGQIIASRVEASQEAITVGRMSRARYRPMVTVYRPIVVYRYTAQGVEHECSRITAGVAVRASDPAPARKIVQRYPSGTAVTVRYNPGKASEAILETSFGGLITGLVFGAILLAVAAGLSGYFQRPA